MQESEYIDIVNVEIDDYDSDCPKVYQAPWGTLTTGDRVVDYDGLQGTVKAVMYDMKGGDGYKFALSVTDNRRELPRIRGKITFIEFNYDTEGKPNE